MAVPLCSPASPWPSESPPGLPAPPDVDLLLHDLFDCDDITTAPIADLTARIRRRKVLGGLIREYETGGMKTGLVQKIAAQRPWTHFWHPSGTARP
jgi:hypothetical protein